MASKAAPDGHTFTIASLVYASGPVTYPDMKLNPAKDLTSIGQISEAPNYLVVNLGVPAKSIRCASTASSMLRLRVEFWTMRSNMAHRSPSAIISTNCMRLARSCRSRPILRP